jgi:putative transposase
VPGHRRIRRHPLKRVVEVLGRLVSLHGAPRFLRSDNGPEFVSRAILKWPREAGIATAFIDPGKPWQNGADESFNGKLRDECLGAERFRTLNEARAVIEDWRRHYNLNRPHSCLGYLSPFEFKRRSEGLPTVADAESALALVTPPSDVREAACPPAPPRGPTELFNGKATNHPQPGATALK